MKISGVVEHFLSRADWVDRDETVDRIILGDPDKDVGRCVVAWIPSFAAIRAVVERGVGLLVCHEPTFWDHFDHAPQAKPRCAEKLGFIRRHNLSIVRLHDTWDRWPEVGIPWAWGRALGLPGPPAEIGNRGYQHRYDIDPVPFDEFAHRIAAHTAPLGEPTIEVDGAPETLVSKIGIGTGCAVGVPAYLGMGCDCCVLTNDGSSYWRDVQRCQDLGIPTITVDHGTSEEPGMATLARYINEQVDGLAAEHLVQGCRFRLVEAADAG